ncbi:MAG: tetraacyldisaccharide 4'-kinase, partial [Ghiorsea sp.]
MFNNLHQRIEAMWWNTNKRPNVFLRGLSYIYFVLSKFDQKSRLNRAVQPSIPMISVGNITVGGSGKTPFVVWLASELKNRGMNPVLLSRGDGANNQSSHLVSEYSKAREIGDEAVLLYRLSGCPVIAGRDRVAGVKMADEYGDVLILDDGFQYRQLTRVCDLVMVPTEGVGNGYLLPAGPLRESVSALNRADVIVRSGLTDFKRLSDKQEWAWSASAGVVRDCTNDEGVILEVSQPVHVVTGIARPNRVVKDMKTLGFDVAKHTFFPDHHDYTLEDVQKLMRSQQSVVTTAKDAVKLMPLWTSDKPLWVL